MKIRCPECGHSATIDPAKIPVGGVMALCPKCPCRFRVQAGTSAPQESGESLLVVCPTCSHEQSFSPTCAKCGVIFARHRPRPAVRLLEPAQKPPQRSKPLPPFLWLAVTLVALLCLYLGVNGLGPPEEKGKTIIPVPLVFPADVQPAAVTAVAANGKNPAPAAVEFAGIAAGFEHSVAFARDGSVWTWGDNNSGQLASCKTGSANSPLQVHEKWGGLLGPVVQVAAGPLHTLAIKADGTVWIWGLKMWARPYVNDSRQGANGIWRGNPHNAIPPTRIAGVEDAVDVVGGQSGLATFAVLHRNGTLSTFGANDQYLPPLQVRPFPGVTEIRAIAAGAREFAALKKDGTVWTWGSSDHKSLKDGSKIQGVIPRQVEQLNNVVKIAAGTESILVVKSDGTVWGWGSNLYARTPGGLQVTSSLVPVQIPDLADIVDIATPGYGYTNGAHFLALDRKGRVWSWGYNQQGQLGQGSMGGSSVRKPVLVEGLDEVTALAAGGMHSLALRRDGSIWSWGGNSSGQLGNDSGSDSAFPVRVILSTVKEGAPR